MLCNPTSLYCVDAKEPEGADMLLNYGIVDTTILPCIDMDQYPGGLSNEFMLNQSIALSRYDEHYDPEMSTDEVYPAGNKQFARMFTEYESFSPSSEWNSKPIYDWNECDIRNWILETASKKVNIAELASFDFAHITGADLLEMSSQDFCDRLYSQTNPAESRSVAAYLYSVLQQMISESHYDQEAIVPSTVMDRFNHDDNLHYPSSDDCEQQFLDLDGHSKLSSEPSCHYKYDIGTHSGHLSLNRVPNCDSGYNSFTEEFEPKVLDSDMLRDGESMGEMSEQSVPTVVAKRPPGRPKGSGKKHPKRIKNVSVPEFLRDLLLNPDFCPRIIKWEDYSAGKFRFVRPDEVAKLWGSKRNNVKMSFEKFSRAMRYHYKQGVLVSVPTARLVYQFGKKAPPYTTSNPNFEPIVGKFTIR